MGILRDYILVPRIPARHSELDLSIGDVPTQKMKNLYRKISDENVETQTKYVRDGLGGRERPTHHSLEVKGSFFCRFEIEFPRII